MKKFSLCLVLVGCVGEDLPSIVQNDVLTGGQEAGVSSANELQEAGTLDAGAKSEAGLVTCATADKASHFNGFETYDSCAPVRTCDYDEALRSCDTYRTATQRGGDCQIVLPASGCASAFVISTHRTADYFDDATWAYDGPAKGHYRSIDAGASPCPTTSDPKWW